MSPIRRCLQSIRQICLQAAGLCKQMLACSGRGHFIVQKIDLDHRVKEMTQLPTISTSKNVTLKFDLAPGIPAVEADASQIRQIVMNLMINASDVIGGKCGVISVRTGVKRADRAYLSETYLSPQLPEGDYVLLEVADSGCGMNAATKAKVFEPFFSTKFAGRGLPGRRPWYRSRAQGRIEGSK